ncbi:MAG: hypothetical protein R3F22_10335 [Lysobacteraceae bacterium]
MSKLSRQIEAVRIAESKLEDRRNDLERNGRRLAKRAKRLLMPHGLLAGGLITGVLADRWLFPSAKSSSKSRNAEPADHGDAVQQRTSFIAEIGSLLAIANSLTPLAMNAMQLHERWQTSRQQGEPPPESTHDNRETADTDAPRGASE